MCGNPTLYNQAKIYREKINIDTINSEKHLEKINIDKTI